MSFRSGSIIPPLALGILVCGQGFAQQDSPKVKHGKVDFTNVSPDTLRIEQSTPRAIIEWRQFDIPEGKSVEFVQPDRTASVLNRITGGDPTEVLGSLTANGRVFLINPNGVVFGQNASVDVAGLLASTLDLLDENYLADRISLEGLGERGGVLNQGRIAADDFVALAGPVAENAGTISVPGGGIYLLGTRSADLVFQDAELVSATLRDLGERGRVVLNPGDLSRPLERIVNTAGLVEAGSVTFSDDGRVFLDGIEGVALNRRTLSTERKDGGTILVHSSQTSVVTNGSELLSDAGLVDFSTLGNFVWGGTVDTIAPGGGYGKVRFDPVFLFIRASPATLPAGEAEPPGSQDFELGDDDDGDGIRDILANDPDSLPDPPANTLTESSISAASAFGVVEIEARFFVQFESVGGHVWFSPSPETFQLTFDAIDESAGGASIPGVTITLDKPPLLTIPPGVSETTFTAVYNSVAKVGIQAPASLDLDGDNVDEHFFERWERDGQPYDDANTIVQNVSKDFAFTAVYDTVEGSQPIEPPEDDQVLFYPLQNRLILRTTETGGGFPFEGVTWSAGDTIWARDGAAGEVLIQSAADVNVGSFFGGGEFDPDPVTGETVQVFLGGRLHVIAARDVTIQSGAVVTVNELILQAGRHIAVNGLLRSDDNNPDTEFDPIPNARLEADWNAPGNLPDWSMLPTSSPGFWSVAPWNADGQGGINQLGGSIVAQNLLLSASEDVDLQGVEVLNLEVQMSGLTRADVNVTVTRNLTTADLELKDLGNVLGFGDLGTLNVAVSNPDGNVEIEIPSDGSLNVNGHLSVNSATDADENGNLDPVTLTLRAEDSIRINNPLAINTVVQAGQGGPEGLDTSGNRVAGTVRLEADSNLGDFGTIFQADGTSIRADTVVLVTAKGIGRGADADEDGVGDSPFTISANKLSVWQMVNNEAFFGGADLRIKNVGDPDADSDPETGTDFWTNGDLALIPDPQGLIPNGRAVLNESPIGESAQFERDMTIVTEGSLTVVGVVEGVDGQVELTATAGDIALNADVLARDPEGDNSIILTAGGGLADDGDQTTALRVSTRSASWAGGDAIAITTGAGSVGSYRSETPTDFSGLIDVDLGPFDADRPLATVRVQMVDGGTLAISEVSQPTFSASQVSPLAYAGTFALANFGGDLTIDADVDATGFFAGFRAGPGALLRNTADIDSAGAAVVADRMTLRGTLDGNTGIVTLVQVTDGVGISLGGEDAAGTLGLDQDELDTITADILRIGNANSGAVDVVASIVNPTGWTSLHLTSGSSIRDATGTEQVDLTVTSLALSSARGIGSRDDQPADDLDTAVTNLAAENGPTGGIRVSNAGALVVPEAGVDGVVGITSSGAGDVQVTAASPLTVDAAVLSTAGGSIALSSSGADDLTINARVQASGGNGSVALTGGGDVLVSDSGETPDLSVAGTGEIAINAGGTVILGANVDVQTAGGDLTVAADDVSINVGATPARLDAGTGTVEIGATTVGFPVDLGSDNPGRLGLTGPELGQIFAAILRIGNANTGDITITEDVSATNVGTLSLESGQGGIEQEVGDALTVADLAIRSRNQVVLNLADNDVDTSSVAAVVTGAGQGFFFRDGNDLAVGSVDGLTGIATNGGDIQLESAGTLSINGAIAAITGGSITLDAGTDAIVNDTGAESDILAEDGSVTVNAGRNTLVRPGVRLVADGLLTLRADDLSIDAAAQIDSGVNGLVEIATMSADRPVDLGTDTAGTLGVTDAELDVIVAGIVKIVSNNGDISITASVTAPPGWDTFVLETNAGIIDDAQGESVLLTMTELALRAGTGIGDGDDLDIAVTRLSAENGPASGAIRLANTGPLTVEAVSNTGVTPGVTNTANGEIVVTTASPLTVNDPIVASGGNVTLTSVSVGGDDGNVTLNDQVSSAGGNGNVVLSAGTNLISAADVTVEGTGTITATVSGETRLNAGADWATGGGNITIATNDLAIAAAATVNAGAGFVIIGTGTQGRDIDLGTDTAGMLALTNGELSRITASVLQIGTLSGDIVISNQITEAPGWTVLSLGAGGGITDTGPGSLTVESLAIRAGGPVILDGANGVGEVAAFLGGEGTGLTFRNLNDLTIGTVDGVNGISTLNGPITVAADDGSVTVENTVAAIDVNAGTSTLTLTAGGANRTFTNSEGARISALGGVTVMADNVVLEANSSVEAGEMVALFATTSQATLVDLGGPDAAGTLGLTDDELDTVSAGVLTVQGASDLTVSAAISSGPYGALRLVAGGEIQANATVTVDVAEWESGGSMFDGNGEANNLVTTGDAILDAGGSIGTLADCLEVVIGGTLFAAAGETPVSIHLCGTTGSGTFELLEPVPGTILWNGMEILDPLLTARMHVDDQIDAAHKFAWTHYRLDDRSIWIHPDLLEDARGLYPPKKKKRD